MCGLAIWWTLEAYMVLIATSIPTLKPILHKGNSGTKKSNTGGSYALPTIGGSNSGPRQPQRDRTSFIRIHETDYEWEPEKHTMHSAIHTVERGEAQAPIEGINKTVAFGFTR